MTIPSSGTVARLSGSRLVTVSRIGHHGDRLQLVLAGTVLVAADLTAGTLVRVGPSGTIGSVVRVPRGFAAVRAAGSDTVPGLVGLVSAQSVVSANAITAAVTSTPLPHPVSAGPAVMRGTDVVLIDNSRHDVLIVDTATRMVRPPLTLPKHQIPDQLTVSDRLVFVNASGSPSALVINGNHVRRITKYTGPPPVQHHAPKPAPTPVQTPVQTPVPNPTQTPVQTPVPVHSSSPPVTGGRPKKQKGPPKRPGAPGDLTAQAGNGQVQLSWDRAEPNGSLVTKYLVSWTANGVPAGHGQVAGTAGGTTITPLENGTSYIFTVTAVNAVGAGPPAVSSQVTPTSRVPATPQGLTAATPRDNDSVTLAWKAPDNGYDIKSYTVWEVGVTTPLLTGITTTSTVLGQLAVGVPVQFEVTAQSSNQVSSAKSVPSTAVVPYLPPAAPTAELASVAQDGDSAVLSVSCPVQTCQEGRPPATYQVTVGSAGQKTVTAPASGAPVSISVGGLNPNNSYTAAVTATDTAGVAGASASVPIATPGPPTVSGVQVIAAGDNLTLNVTAMVNEGQLSATTCSVTIAGVTGTFTGTCGSTIPVPVPMYNTSYTATLTATNADGTASATGTGTSGLDALTADATDAFGTCPTVNPPTYCGGNSHLESTPNFAPNNGAPLVTQGTQELASCWTTGGVDHGTVSPYTAPSTQWVFMPQGNPGGQPGYMSILWFPSPYTVVNGLPHC